MRLRINDRTYFLEQFKILLFRGKKWKLFEVRNDFVDEIVVVSNFKFYRLVMIIAADITTPEVFSDNIQNLASILVLAYRETRSEFPS